MIAIAPILLSALLAAPSQSQSGFGGPDRIPWRTYKAGQLCKVLSPKQIVVTNGANWQAYWNEVTGEAAANAPKDLDFAKEQVIGLHLGIKPTGGYEVYVEAIRQTGPAECTVYYVESTPPFGQMVTQAQTTPYVMVRMPRVPGIVYFAKKVQPGRPGIDWGEGSCHCCCYCTGFGGPIVVGYVWSGFPSFSGNPFDPLQNIKWRTFDSGTNSKIAKFETNVMENDASWQTYWSRNFGSPPQTAPKKIDWLKQRAIAINLGNMSGGASVYVESVQRKNAANIEITYVVSSSTTRGGGQPVLGGSSPYVIMTLDRVAGIFTYRRRDVQLPPSGRRSECRCGCGHCRFQR